MRYFSNFGIKMRNFPDYNYKAIWSNCKVFRVGSGSAKELPPDRAEFYDIGIGTKCNLGTYVDYEYLPACHWCYVDASTTGVHYEDICETWIKWMDTFPEDKTDGKLIVTEKPFNIAIGSTGEPTTHPQFTKFLETVYNTGVVPCYTTNGVILSAWNKPKSKNHILANEILDATRNYVAGVAVSLGNKALRTYAHDAIQGLIGKGDTNINIHHLISDKDSVQDFIDTWHEYGSEIKYHVLLPLMKSGRSNKGMDPESWKILEKAIIDLDIKNVSFGAHFYEYLKKSELKVWLFEPESFSKNVLLMKDQVIITPSSFNLEPMATIYLDNSGPKTCNI